MSQRADTTSSSERDSVNGVFTTGESRAPVVAEAVPRLSLAGNSGTIASSISPIEASSQAPAIAASATPEPALSRVFANGNDNGACSIGGGAVGSGVPDSCMAAPSKLPTAPPRHAAVSTAATSRHETGWAAAPGLATRTGVLAGAAARELPCKLSALLAALAPCPAAPRAGPAMRT